MRTGVEAAEYAAELQRVVRYLGIGNGNMQEGSLRCDVNVSVRPRNQKEFGTKVASCSFTTSGSSSQLLESVSLLITACSPDRGINVGPLVQVEVKNMNSFSAMKLAIDFEIARQVALLEKGCGDQIVQETRLWEEGAQVCTCPSAKCVRPLEEIPAHAARSLSSSLSSREP